MTKEKIVVLGAGYGGLRVVKELQKKNLNATITLINKNDYHYEATYLHEVAAGTNPAEKITFKIDDVVNTNKVAFIQDTVVTIDKENKQVVIKNGEAVTYDYLVVALGFESESFNIPGVDEFSECLVDIPTAESANKKLLKQLANYAQTNDQNDLNIVVCGAGFTSIEYLGELTNKLPKLSKELNFPLDQVTITCIEAMDKILPMFTEKLSTYGVDVLKKRGVTFLTGTPIKEIKSGAVVYQQGEELKEVSANTVIWTTGVKGSSVIENSNFDARRGRVMVEDDLSVASHPEIFMIGDVSAVMDKANNRPYPTTAQIALKQADTVVLNLIAKLNNQAPTSFSYKSAGTVCSIGDNEAIAEVAGRHFKGYIASVMKKGVADKSLLQVGNQKVLLKKGRFDFYH